MTSTARIPFRAAAVVAKARSQVRYVEKPTNRTKYGARYGLDGYAWCGIFVWWVFYDLGWDLRHHGIPHPASTNDFDGTARGAGWKLIAPAKMLPGDVVIYDFGITGPGDSANDADHIGIVTRKVRLGYFKAAEGNTSSGNRGSQANGGGVYERTRSVSLVKSVWRPPYGTAPAKAKPVTRRAAPAKKKTSTKAKVTAGAVVVIVGSVGAGTAVRSNLPTTAAPRPQATATRTPGPTTSSTRPTPAKTAAARTTYQRPLRYRAGVAIITGADVRAVQRLVGVPVTGRYDSKTAAAVRAWQIRSLRYTGDWTRTDAVQAGWRLR